jgi:hypothetical protein
VHVRAATAAACRASGEKHVALHTLSALNDLAPYDAEIIGADLFDATERWEAAYDESKRNPEIKRKLLFDRVANIDGTAQSTEAFTDDALHGIGGSRSRVISDESG